MKRLGAYGITLLLVAAMLLPLVPSCMQRRLLRDTLSSFPRRYRAAVRRRSCSLHLYGRGGPFGIGWW